MGFCFVAKSGDRHRWDGARSAAREARARERRGGRRRRCRGDGGQSRRLESPSTRSLAILCSRIFNKVLICVLVSGHEVTKSLKIFFFLLCSPFLIKLPAGSGKSKTFLPTFIKIDFILNVHNTKQTTFSHVSSSIYYSGYDWRVLQKPKIWKEFPSFTPEK